MNKNTRNRKPAILAANIGAKRKSNKAKVAAKEQSGENRGPSLMDQMRMLGNYKNISK